MYSSYGGYSGPYGNNMYSGYGGGYGGMYGGSGMYGGPMYSGGMGGPYGGYGMGMSPYNQGPNSFGPPTPPPGFWVSFLRVVIYVILSSYC
jgi:peroxin-13